MHESSATLRRPAENPSTDDVLVGTNNVSELIVHVFRDEYRAPEVLNELRRRDWSGVIDLDDAVAVIRHENGQARVHLTVDLTLTQGATWVRLWASLLGITLLLPLADLIVDAANGVPEASGAPEGREGRGCTSRPGANWWKDCLHLSDDFIRDVGAAVGPGNSAIFMLARAPNQWALLRRLSNYGGTVLHTALNSEQDEKMQAELALR
jgi:uncharacterized membrane protein